MKVKTVVISLAVTGALVAGGIYGAYYMLQSRKSPVEVVPVANVNSGYWGTTNTIYGTVTSQVAQNVTLDEEYAVDEIYVEAGQEVKEGDPLFSYDMTLPELELELKELELQTYELEKTRLERDLERLRNGTYTTASLESNDMGSMTASGEMDLIIEEPEGAGGSGSSQGGGSGSGFSIDSATVVSESTEGSTEGSQNSTEGSQSSTETQQASSEGSGSTGESSLTPETVPETTPGTEAAPSTEGGETEPGIEIESVETVEGTVEAQAGESGKVEIDPHVSAFITSYEEIQRSAEAGLTGVDEFGTLIASTLNNYHNYLCDMSQNTELAIDQGLTIPLYIYNLSEQAKQNFQSVGITEEDVDFYIESIQNYGLQYLQAKNTNLSGSTIEGLSLEAISGLLNVPQAVYNSLDDTGKKREAYAYVAYAVRLLGINIQEGLNDKIKSVNNAYLLLNETANAAFLDAVKSDSVLTSAWQNVRKEIDSMDGKYYARQYAQLLVGTELISEKEARPGETVTFTASEIEFYQFNNWIVLGEDGSNISLENSYASEISFIMPEGDVTVTANYTVDSAAVNSCVNQFMELAESLQSEGAAQSKTYLEALQEAINLYQSMLASLPADILDESGAAMEDYELKQEVWTYTDTDIQTLEDSYKSLCLAYVNALISSLDPQALTREALDAAENAYAKLGVSWSQEITTSYLLDAYEVILMIQEIDTTQSAETVTAAVQAAADAYYALTEEGKAAVWNLDVLESLMEQYGIQWPSEEETESELWDDFGDFGDFGDMGMDEGYTSEEIQSMIKDTERQIAEKDRQIREAEIQLGQSQRIVDGKVVRSTLDGTVISIGEADGTSEDDYFVKVASAAGLYARGSMNELDLETIHVGDTISGMLMDTGVSFTAEIVEISEYPDTSGESMNYGSENTNASYYPFMALIDDTEEITEGDAELYLTDTVTDYSNIITLENYFIRTENDGRSYVYIQGEDGRLKKQYVELGQEFYAMVVEIRSGLDESDLIAFPYGDDVTEGAPTKEVDALTY